MSASPEKQSFWTTIPGILTGVAALLSAVTGLLVVMHHPANTASSADQPEAPIVSGITPASKSDPGGQLSAAPQIPKTGSDVTLTSRTGEVTKLSVKSFRHNYTEDTIQLKSGQSISFEKLRTIDFLSVNDDAHEVTIHVTLVDGRVLDGQMASNYAFKGESDIGSFSIFVQDVKQIAFPR